MAGNNRWSRFGRKSKKQKELEAKEDALANALPETPPSVEPSHEVDLENPILTKFVGQKQGLSPFEAQQQHRQMYNTRFTMPQRPVGHGPVGAHYQTEESFRPGGRTYPTGATPPRSLGRPTGGRGMRRYTNPQMAQTADILRNGGV